MVCSRPRVWGWSPVLARGDVVAREGRRLLACAKFGLLQEKNQVRALRGEPGSELGEPGPDSIAVKLHEF